MRKIFLLLYYGMIQHLPSSFFPMGSIFNRIRTLCLRRLIKIGNNTKIQSSVYIGNGIGIEIGNNCQINENVKLDNVFISDYVMIAPGVTILGKMHNYSDMLKPMVLQGETAVDQTIIESNVWIATNAIIMPGLKISSGCIIGAGAVLTKNTIPNGIYVGVPAKFIKFRNEV